MSHRNDATTHDLLAALKQLLAVTCTDASDAELRDAVENAFAPELREHAEACLAARAAVARAEASALLLTPDAQRLRELLDWTETLLCNAKPQAHCTQAEWDSLISKWMEQKHAQMRGPHLNA